MTHETMPSRENDAPPLAVQSKAPLTMQAKVMVPGTAAGRALVSDEPLSFWGGYDQHTGEIIDRRHPLSGQRAAGRVLALRASRGSSTTAAVLLESVRLGTAPCAILTAQMDTFLTLASIVADEMYRRPIPILVISPDQFATLRTGQQIAVAADGTVIVEAGDSEFK
jgi:predicted aconitase with swiveling domain